MQGDKVFGVVRVLRYSAVTHDAAGTQVSLTLTFPMELSTISANMSAFVSDLESQLATAAGLPKSNVKVTSVKAGSVIARCDMLFPASTHTNADAAAFAMNAELLPAGLTDFSFKSKWGMITTCSAIIRVITSGR